MRVLNRSFSRLALTFALGISLLSPSPADPVYDSLAPRVLEDYRWFHAHPELSGQEVQTSKYMATRLREYGLEVTENVGGYGVLAVLRGKHDGPLVIYRADMDALPVQEQTGLPYASKTPQTMHACGHDIHMSTALGTLGWLSRERDRLAGTILFIGQPAEETGAGAEAILADPKFKKLLTALGQKPRVALALHDDAQLHAGQVSLTPGFITANVDSVDIVLKGRGGHGAVPSATVDPVVMASELVMAVQTIVSRKLPAGTRAVVTVGVLQAGTKRNIIPSEALLQLTVRSYEESIRSQIVEELKKLAEGISLAHGAPEPPTVHHHADNYTPAGINDEAWTDRLAPVLQEILGKENVVTTPPSMVGEDFSEYSRKLGIPSVMFLVGTRGPATPENSSLHSPFFAPDAEPTIKAAVSSMRGCLLRALEAEI